MKVRARYNVKDGAGWHMAGDVFETEEDLGDAVEALETVEPEKPVVAEPKEEAPQEEVKPRSRRKKASA